MEYTREYLVHYYEIDRKRRLTLPALIRYFEDIATLDSEARGFTLDYYDKSGHGLAGRETAFGSFHLQRRQGSLPSPIGMA